MHLNDTAESRLFQFPKDVTWRALNQVFSLRMVNLTRYERHLPRIPYRIWTSKIRLSRGGVAETTKNHATYNFEDTFENNLFTITGPFVPDDMEGAQTMRFQIMKLLKACPTNDACAYGT